MVAVSLREQLSVKNSGKRGIKTYTTVSDRIAVSFSLQYPMQSYQPIRALSLISDRCRLWYRNVLSHRNVNVLIVLNKSLKGWRNRKIFNLSVKNMAKPTHSSSPLCCLCVCSAFNLSPGLILKMKPRRQTSTRFQRLF